MRREWMLYVLGDTSFILEIFLEGKYHVVLKKFLQYRFLYSAIT